jgi:hypothetical protein
MIGPTPKTVETCNGCQLLGECAGAVYRRRCRDPRTIKAGEGYPRVIDTEPIVLTPAWCPARKADGGKV